MILLLLAVPLQLPHLSVALVLAEKRSLSYRSSHRYVSSPRTVGSSLHQAVIAALACTVASVIPVGARANVPFSRDFAFVVDKCLMLSRGHNQSFEGSYLISLPNYFLLSAIHMFITEMTTNSNLVS